MCDIHHSYTCSQLYKEYMAGGGVPPKHVTIGESELTGSGEEEAISSWVKEHVDVYI